MMHLFIFAVGLIAICGLVGRPEAPALALAALAGGAAAGFVAYAKAPPRRLRGWRVWAWGLWPVLGAAATVGVALIAGRLWRLHPPFAHVGPLHLVVLECFLAVAGGVAYLAYEYDRRQEGALPVAGFLGAAVGVVFIAHLLLAEPSHAGIAVACLRTVELCYL